MNGRTRKRIYPILAQRDGEECSLCGVTGNTTSLVIDHRDNNNNNNDLDNYQLLCRSCNGKKNPKGKRKVSTNETTVQQTTASREVILKERYEPKFIEWIKDQIKRWERIGKEEVINSGAQITGASQQTITRYLNKLCSGAGMYHYTQEDGIDFVELKPHFKPE